MNKLFKRTGTSLSSESGTLGIWKVAPILGAGLGVVMGAYALHGARSAGGQYGAAQSQPRSESSASSIEAATETVSLTATPIITEATGTIRAEFEAPLAARVMARVVRVAVREGEHVKKGQTLIWLDALDLDASVRQASAGVNAASAGYGAAQTAAHMESALSAARIDQAHSKAAEAEAGLQAAKARLDMVLAGPRKQEREQATLAVTQAKAALNLAEANQKRMDELFKEGAISAQQLDQYRTAAEASRAQYQSAVQARNMVDEGSRTEEVRAARQALRQAQAGVQEAASGIRTAEAAAMQTALRQQEALGAKAQISLSKASLDTARIARTYATITAPFDGVVTRRNADPGAMASPGMPLLTIDGGKMRLEAIVPESVLPSASKGQIASVVLSQAGIDKSIPTTVSEVTPQGDPASHTFTVKLNLPEGQHAISGMFGKALFTTAFRNNLTVPNAALLEREGLRFVYTVDASGIAHLRMVTVGNSAAGRTTVLSGLNPGEKIVAAGGSVATEGAVIRPVSGK